jgi:hypothetical protein
VETQSVLASIDSAINFDMEVVADQHVAVAKPPMPIPMPMQTEKMYPTPKGTMGLMKIAVLVERNRFPYLLPKVCGPEPHKGPLPSLSSVKLVDPNAVQTNYLMTMNYPMIKVKK